jgi:hypothetical protein
MQTARPKDKNMKSYRENPDSEANQKAERKTSKQTAGTLAIRVQRFVRRLCVICGAKVRNQNPKTNTCDPICTRAKHASRTRQEQIEHEMAIDEYNDCMAGHAHLWYDTDEPRVKRKARI